MKENAEKAGDEKKNIRRKELCLAVAAARMREVVSKGIGRA